jgi:hypothetical protein
MATATATKLRNFIDGKTMDPANGRTEEELNPATAEPFAEAPVSTSEDVDRAVAAARRAFEEWARTTPKGALRGGPPARHRNRGARRGAGRPRIGGRWQAARLGDRGGDAGKRRQPAVLRGRGTLPVRPGLGRVRRGPHIDHPPRAGWRGGPDRFGLVWINDHITFCSEMSHGGYTESGYGKDMSVYALQDYTEIKHVMVSLD